jgi:hypothetical protein
MSPCAMRSCPLYCGVCQTSRVPPLLRTAKKPRKARTLYHSMKDLRNGNVVRNVTRSSARKLWRYAITEHESNPVKEDQVRWHGNLGVWKSSKRAGKLRFDLVQRMPDGQLDVYYGVTEDGIDGAWRVIADENAS